MAAVLMEPASSGLLRLPHEVLVDLLVQLETRALGRLAATCRLLQYAQSSPETPNPVERLRIELHGWSRTLPVDARWAVKSLLRLAWQADLENHCICADRERPISLFVDSGGSLRSCGVELQDTNGTYAFLEADCAARGGSLGFGYEGDSDSDFVRVRKEEPTRVPAAEGVRMRSVAIGGEQALALTDEGQVYTWSNFSGKAPDIPTLFKEIGELKMRRVAAGAWHSAALTAEGKLYTWLDGDSYYDLEEEQDGAAGLGYQIPDPSNIYPMPDLYLFLEGMLCRPRCVETLANMRIVSVAAGHQFTILVTDQGRTFSFGNASLRYSCWRSQVLPKEIKALRGVDVESVSAVNEHVLALTYTGGVYSWGDHRLALGHGDDSDGGASVGNQPKWRSRRIEALRGVRVRCIAAGRVHSCAVTDEGHVYTWGAGQEGALGHMEFEDEPLPKRVETLYDNGVFAVSAAAGGHHTLVADANGAVWDFGCLNAIGAWNHPVVKAMRDAEDGMTDDDDVFADSVEFPEHAMTSECYEFLFPHGRASISMPLRIPVDVRGPMRPGAA